MQRKSLAGRVFSLVVLGVPLVGLAVLGEWLGFVLVLALTPLAGGTMERLGWPRPAQAAIVALGWVILMEAFFTLFDGDGYNVVAALILAAAFGALMTPFYIWDMMRARRQAS